MAVLRVFGIPFSCTCMPAAIVPHVLSRRKTTNSGDSEIPPCTANRVHWSVQYSNRDSARFWKHKISLQSTADISVSSGISAVCRVEHNKAALFRADQ